MFARLHIGHKLFAANLVSVFVVLVLAGGLLLERNHSLLQAHLNDRITKQSAIVASSVVAAVIFDDWDNVKEIASTLLSDPAIVSISLVDVEGDERHFLRSQVRRRGGLQFVVPIMDGSSTIGSIRIRASEAEVWAASRTALWSILSITLLASLAGLLVSNRLQGLVTRPISDLSALLRRIRSSSEYELRARIAYPDEIGELSEDLNSLLSMIEERDRYLEEQVRNRTAELESEMQQRRESEKARLESQQRFERAFASAPIGMALVNGDGRLMQRNRSLERILGTPQDATLLLADIMEDPFAATIDEQFAQQVAGERNEFDLDVRCRAADGSTIFAHVGFAAVRDDSDAFLYSVLQLQDVTQARLLAQELEHQANHDELTGLGNRRTLEKQLELAHHACRAHNMPYTLVIMDLDQFKVVNDTSGHAAGDALLVQIAQLVRGALRQDDVVVRLGGDEFALLLKGCCEEKALELLESIRCAIEELAFHWEGSVHRVGMSAGAVYVDQHMQSATEIMQQADAACFAAKDAGRNQVLLHQAKVSANDDNRGELRWVQRLHAAVDNDQFLLYVQPVVPLQQTQQSEHLEVLLRLRNPERNSLIPPGAFMPAAARYGLSTKIDRWVVQKLLRMARTYRDLFDDQRCYWVNLTTESFSDDAFMQYLIKSLGQADLPAGSINFEITETTVVRNLTEAHKVMNQLRDMGCRFALDDFGRGLSSFAYLKRLPVDVLKIDGMFVRDIVEDRIDRMFVQAIIEIAHALSCEVVAEFVESEDILQLVTALGADYGQGFALGRPELLLPQGARDSTDGQPGGQRDIG